MKKTKKKELTDAEFLRDAVKLQQGKDSATGPVLRISVKRPGDKKFKVKKPTLLVEALRSNRLKVHGMGTFAEKLKKGDVDITPEALQFLKDSPHGTRGMAGLDLWDEVIGWFGVGPSTLVEKDEICVNAWPKFL